MFVIVRRVLDTSGRRTSPRDDEARPAAPWPWMRGQISFAGVLHRLDVGSIIQRAGETQCRHLGFPGDAVERRQVHAVRHDMHGVASADPAQPSRIRLARAHGRGVAAHGAVGVARRDGISRSARQRWRRSR